MWAVVIFDELGEVEAVPYEWISKCQTKVSWPPFKSTSKVTKLIRNKESASDLWPVYSSRVLRTYDTYEEALRGSKIAEDTSDLVDEDVELGRGSRVIKRKIFELDEDPTEVTQNKKNRSFPVAPPVPDSLSRWGGPQSDPPSPARFGLSTPCLSSSPGSGSGISSSGSNADVYKNLVLSIVELKHIMLSQGQMIKALHDKLAGVHAATSVTPEEEFDVQFPIQELEEFLQHEEKLKTNGYKRYLTRLLSSFGAISLKLLVRKLVDHTMTNGLQRQFNWLGKTFWSAPTETRRRSFKETHLCSVITTSIRQTKGYDSISDEEVHCAIKVYFRNAKDRQGGRTARLARPEST